MGMYDGFGDGIGGAFVLLMVICIAIGAVLGIAGWEFFGWLLSHIQLGWM